MIDKFFIIDIMYIIEDLIFIDLHPIHFHLFHHPLHLFIHYHTPHLFILHLFIPQTLPHPNFYFYLLSLILIYTFISYPSGHFKLRVIMLKININVSQSEHTDGYCSDENLAITSTNFVRTRVLYDVPSSLHNASDEDIKAYITTRIDMQTMPCQKGSGYCVCCTKYNIKSFKWLYAPQQCSDRWRRRFYEPPPD